MPNQIRSSSAFLYQCGLPLTIMALHGVSQGRYQCEATWVNEGYWVKPGYHELESLPTFLLIPQLVHTGPPWCSNVGHSSPSGHCRWLMVQWKPDPRSSGVSHMFSIGIPWPSSILASVLPKGRMWNVPFAQLFWPPYWQGNTTPRLDILLISKGATKGAREAGVLKSRRSAGSHCDSSAKWGFVCRPVSGLLPFSLSSLP
ncbi:hypothetical protein F4859DRAFT_90783 [Xylaria cf. heliscus]|nr:hypothetical protein F4859DRAFT_90783 [Xylaria cf. heliscus]